MLDKLNEIKKLLSELDSEIGQYITSDPSPEDACSLLAEMSSLKQDVSFVYETFSFGVIRIMGDSEFITLPNGVEIEKRGGYDRKKWNHKDLGSAVVDKLVKMSVDMDTGEILKTPEDIALDILTYCAPSYWRVKELNKIGINADNYCEVGDLRTSIIVRKPKN